MRIRRMLGGVIRRGAHRAHHTVSPGLLTHRTPKNSTGVCMGKWSAVHVGSIIDICVYIRIPCPLKRTIASLAHMHSLPKSHTQAPRALTPGYPPHSSNHKSRIINPGSYHRGVHHHTIPSLYIHLQQLSPQDRRLRQFTLPVSRTS